MPGCVVSRQMHGASVGQLHILGVVAYARVNSVPCPTAVPATASTRCSGQWGSLCLARSMPNPLEAAEPLPPRAPLGAVLPGLWELERKDCAVWGGLC